jgi:hypothetical protein
MAIRKEVRSVLRWTCDQICASDLIAFPLDYNSPTCYDLQPAELIIRFVDDLIVSCKPDAANAILGKLFQVPEFCNMPQGERTFEFFWSYFSGRPTNTPWPQWDEKRLAEEKRLSDPENVQFYDGWSDASWITETQGIAIGDDYDAHQWKDSSDCWTQSICAHLLCQPKDGRPPSREALQEAFEALEKLSTMTLPAGYGNIFNDRSYFIITMYLGHFQRAREIFQQIGIYRFGDEFFCNPAFYQLLMTFMSDPPIKRYNAEEAKEIVQQVCTALDTKLERPSRVSIYKEPIKSPVSDLLQRLSIAAFSVYQGDYLAAGINSPADILLPAITAERITEIEQHLGAPLPPDVKEIAMVANGFYGGWNFAGGGWSGISKNVSVCPADDCAMWMGDDGEDDFQSTQTNETRTRDDGSTYEELVDTQYDDETELGNVYVSSAPADCDGYIHFMCPPETWRTFQKARRGIESPDGEYAVFYHAPWQDSSDVHIFKSLTEWLTNLMLSTEAEAEASEQENDGEENEGSN